MSALDFLSGQVLRSTAGTIYTGAKASYWSDAGATTPLTVYSDAGLSSAHTNPVVADGTTGAFPAIFIQARRYWRTVTDSAGVSLPQFNIGPIDHPTLFASAAAPSPTYPYLRYYNTSDGHVYRRNAANSAWIDEGLVDSLINAATVTEQLAGTETGKASTPDSVAGLWQRGADITAGATLSLPAGGGGTYNLAGAATTITGISSASGGRRVEFRMNDAHTLTHNGTSFILPGAADIIAVSGDIYEFTNEAATDATGSNWRCTKMPPTRHASIASKTGNYTATTADRNKSIRFAGLSADATLTLPSAATCGNGFVLYVSNEDTTFGASGPWAVTIDGNGAETIDGQATRKCHTGTRVVLMCDGSNWRTVAGEYIIISTRQTINAGDDANYAHGQGVAPKRVWIMLENLTTEGGYAVGDYIFTMTDLSSASTLGFAWGCDATNLFYVVGSSGPGRVFNKTTGAAVTLTPANWALRLAAAF